MIAKIARIKIFISSHYRGTPFFQVLLPDAEHLQLQSWSIDSINAHITLNISSNQTEARCPLCQQTTRRIHSRYERMLKDLCWAEHGVTLRLQVSKFFCLNALCQRRIFTERLPQVVSPWARYTCRLVNRIQSLALALGGNAGVRLAQQWGYSISRNTLLNLLSKLSMPSVSVPKQLGVDDFAFRRGQRYGTIIVELEQHCPIALLSDREANTLAEWLKTYPSVEVLSRDRSKSYRQGMSEGAPQAMQVADRFHLLQNLSETLEQHLRQKSQALKAAELAYCRLVGTIPVIAAQLPPSRQALADQRHQHRIDKHQQVHHLRQQGLTISEIAAQLRMGKRTVYTYLSLPSIGERQPKRVSKVSILEPYKGYLVEQWNAGHRQVKQLFYDIKQQGYGGTYETVTRFTQRLARSGKQAVLQQLGIASASVQLSAKHRPLTARRASWIVLQPPHKLSKANRMLLEQMSAQPELSPAISLAQTFAKIVRERLSGQLDVWLEQATNSSIVAFQNFAKSLQEDYEAVKAGVTVETSNGQAEGQINRLKMLKRQIYGRAGLDLLRRRFLIAS